MCGENCMSVRTIIAISPEVIERIKPIARRLGLSVNEVVEMAVKEFLKKEKKKVQSIDKNEK
jgi:hypothetical protein